MNKSTPLKAIRIHCLKCHGWEPSKEESHKPVKDVRECEVTDCEFWEYRFGKNPNHARSKAKRLLESAPFVKKHHINP